EEGRRGRSLAAPRRAARDAGGERLGEGAQPPENGGGAGGAETEAARGAGEAEGGPGGRRLGGIRPQGERAGRPRTGAGPGKAHPPAGAVGEDAALDRRLLQPAQRVREVIRLAATLAERGACALRERRG